MMNKVDVNLSEDSLRELQEFALSLVEATRKIVVDGFNSEVAVDTKQDESPVTIVDRECERIIRQMLKDRFPSHGIIGEEFGSTDENAEYVWVIDPLDGTRSFITGGLDFGTLIGVLKCGEPILGIISQPVLNQVLIGDNRSCFFNGRAVKVRNGVELSEAICLVTDLKLAERFQNKDGFQTLMKKAGTIKTWGNCFGYTLLARGLVDAMIDPIMSPWDLLPLIPIIRGAGGIITDYQGGNPVASKSIVAASPSLHSEIVSLLNPPFAR